MNYLIERLTPRQFEVLAANYAKSIAPHYDWFLTPKTVDFNRDFEAVYNNSFKWGEAKHTHKSSSSISKSRWDPTLVSAVLKNNVDEIYLVTCGWIPLEYIVRAEHFKQKSIKKIFYINRYLLDEWLKDHSAAFDDFNEHDDMTKIMKSIESNSNTNNPKDACIINIFSLIDNILEPIDTIEKMVIYEINITVFSLETTQLALQLPKSFIITDVKIIALSPNNNELCCNSICDTDNVRIKKYYKVQKGYNQVLVNGFFNNTSNDSETICVELNRKTIKKRLLLNKSSSLSKDKLSDLAAVENAFDTCLINKQNMVIYSHYLEKNNLTRNKGFASTGEYNYYEFTGSVCNDAVTICRFISKLLLGVDYSLKDELIAEKTINSALNLCPFWISNIFAGMTNYIYALCAIENLERNDNVLNSFSRNVKLPIGSIVFIEKHPNLSSLFQKVLSLVFDLFTTARNSSLIIINSPKIAENMESFYKPQDKTNISNNLTTEISRRKFEMQTIESIWNKNIITSDYIKRLYIWGNHYYEKTDFFKAHFFYDLIDRKAEHISGYIYIDYIFKYADCLNHCDSMEKAKRQFERVIKEGNINDPREAKLVLEAKTEVFNLRFWRLETEHLVEDIDKMLNDCYSQLYVHNGNKRDRYAFYNCLNRKMVTQYLMADYQCAEATFQQYIDCVDSNHMNYLAFAYMDSARGLYMHNIFLAKKRLETAINILKELFLNGKEQRRYFDCLVELEYVKFIIDYETEDKADISFLELAVTNVRNHGYKSMLIKCYLKLATCYLAQKNIDLATQYLSYVKSNCDFNDDIRTAVLYNKILSNLYSIKNLFGIHLNSIVNDFVSGGRISFNCIANGDILLETRIW